MYTVRETGQPNTPDYRVNFENAGNPISSWHDIPLYANEEQTVLNMVVEIPRWTNAKFEVAKTQQAMFKGNSTNEVGLPARFLETNSLTRSNKT